MNGKVPVERIIFRLTVNSDVKQCRISIFCKCVVGQAPAPFATVQLSGYSSSTDSNCEIGSGIDYQLPGIFAARPHPPLTPALSPPGGERAAVWRRRCTRVASFLRAVRFGVCGRFLFPEFHRFARPPGAVAPEDFVIHDFSAYSV